MKNIYQKELDKINSYTPEEREKLGYNKEKINLLEVQASGTIPEEIVEFFNKINLPIDSEDSKEYIMDYNSEKDNADPEIIATLSKNLEDAGKYNFSYFRVNALKGDKCEMMFGSPRSDECITYTKGENMEKFLKQLKKSLTHFVDKREIPNVSPLVQI